MLEFQKNRFNEALERSKFFAKELRPLVIGDSCCKNSLVLADDELSESLYTNVLVDPKDCDLLIVHGVITKDLVPYIKKVHAQMIPPFIVMSVGQCALSGAFFNTMALSDLIHVDIDVPGCAPDAEELVSTVSYARRLLKDKLNNLSEANNGP